MRSPGQPRVDDVYVVFFDGEEAVGDWSDPIASLATNAAPLAEAADSFKKNRPSVDPTT